MVPLAIHEDAAPCNKTSSVVCKSFSSLIGAGDKKVTKFYLPQQDQGGWL